MKNFTTKNSSAPKTTRHTGREIGLELRKTHFILGNHSKHQYLLNDTHVFL